MESQRHARGIVLVTAATVLWSTAGLFVRALDLDVWTIQAWRSLFGALALVAIVFIQHGSRTPAVFRSIGRAGLAAVPVSAISMLAYIAALELTTVANVMVVYATVPFVAAGIAFVWIGERPARNTLVASAIALLGISVMAGSATRAGDVAGNALSLLMTASFSVLLVMVRRHPSLPMAPINALGAALCAILCWPLMPAGVPGAVDLAILALFGLTTMGIGYLLFLAGGRLIPSSEAGLIGLLDVILGPLWVWLAFGEQPGEAALTGGGIVFSAVLWYLAGARRNRVC